MTAKNHGEHAISLICTAVIPGLDLITTKRYRGAFVRGGMSGKEPGFWVELEPARYRWEAAWKFRPANPMRLHYWHEVI